MKLSLVPRGEEKIGCKDVMSDWLVGGNVFGSINLFWHHLITKYCILNDGFQYVRFAKHKILLVCF